ncbi:pyruvate dehydrogenase complex dihydrolipoamide acetyltransferase [Mesorhizobium sp. CAU 1741]|uniref:pyruvate dehydrogenase complex dihydrolipoamide acetyltransferase n=1 Tax=Mesorhizobium sp. CAU 1741 TaxID=3140366 RepID=UPI00325AB3DF
MPVEVILPKVDMDMATGRITRWYAEEGAVVKQGDVLFEIETDKAAMEIDAPASGTVRAITGAVGVDIPVGEPVAWIYAEGEDAGTIPDKPAAGSSSRAEPSASEQEAKENADVVAVQGKNKAEEQRPDGQVRATPLARRIAKDSGVDIAGIAGSGPRGRVVRADVDAAIAGGTPPSGLPAISPSGGEIRQSPTSELPISALEGEMAGRPEGGISHPKPMSDDTGLKLFEEGSYELVPHDAMRRTIARRLVEAKSTIPHFYLTLDCEIDALLALRKQLNDAAPKVKSDKGEEPAYKLSVNDLVIKAMAVALRAVPDANASWTEGGMLKHKHADVGVAVSIPGGLITPIVRKADEKTLSVISNEMKDLAMRARNRKLKPEEYQGGTTAVSNLGMFGIKDFAAVINPPHATILAVGAGEERAVVKGGQVVVANVMSVTLSTDHRAVDGALGAELLAAFKRAIENPLTMLV